VNSKDKIIDYISNLPEIIRLHELESFFDKNEEIKNKLNELNTIKKKMVNSKEFNQINQYKIYKNDYDNLLNEINEYPFMEEYLELLEFANNLLNEIKDKIEFKLDKIINE